MGREKTKPVLLISILDPTCKNGLVKQAIVLDQLGIPSLTVCTSIANQNDVEIDDITWLSYEEIKRQLDSIGRKYWIDTAAISHVGNLNLVILLVNYLHMTRPGIQLVWEPSFQYAEREHLCLNNQEKSLFIELCQKVSLTLLNIRDLPCILEHVDEQNMRSLADKGNLYIKEESLSKETCTDFLYYEKTLSIVEYSSPEVHTLHDTEFFSTLISFLHTGSDIPQACKQTCDFMKSSSY